MMLAKPIPRDKKKMVQYEQSVYSLFITPSLLRMSCGERNAKIPFRKNPSNVIVR